MANLKIKKLSSKKQRVNWHEAAACAVQIDLRDYNHLLEFFTEYPLGKKDITESICS